MSDVIHLANQVAVDLLPALIGLAANLSPGAELDGIYMGTHLELKPIPVWMIYFILFTMIYCTSSRLQQMRQYSDTPPVFAG